MKLLNSGLLAFLALLVLVAGCAIPFSTGDTNSNPVPPIEKTFIVPMISLQDIHEGGIALGGVVIRHDVEVYRYPDLPAPGKRFDHFDQTEFWSSNCERVFADNPFNIPLTPFYQFNDFVEDDLLESIWTRHAQGGHLAPAFLESIQSAGPGVRFLLLFRVEYDDISHDIDTAWSRYEHSEAGLGKISGSGHDPNLVNKSKHPTIKRLVGLTMSIYDLKLGLCVWEAGIVEDVSRSVDPQSLDDWAGYQAKQIETGEVVLVEDDELPDSPAFNQVMEKCLGTLCREMFKVAELSS